jgi:hypothetical protein
MKQTKLIPFHIVKRETAKLSFPISRLELLYSNYRERWRLQQQNKRYHAIIQKAINYAIKYLEEDDELRTELCEFLIAHKASEDTLNSMSKSGNHEI